MDVRQANPLGNLASASFRSMNSLVGYGVSSESDSEGDVEDANNSGVGLVPFHKCVSHNTFPDNVLLP